MSGLIGEIAEIVPTVQAHALNQHVNELFKQDKSCFGIVVVQNDAPIGLVTRTNFYQKLGSLYGYNLYIGRPIELLMNKSILVVDQTTSIIDVSKLAMQRKEEELYDHVILTRYGSFAGVVSISRLLIKFAEVQTQIASYLNPLTGLPGNRSIEEQLDDVLTRKSYSVLYIDIDHFKTYNDRYGFSKGDQVIQETASLLKRWMKKASGFLGHIGGDDFLMILHNHDYKGYCNSILREFDNLLVSFYSQKHLLQNFVYAEDRLGVKRKIPLLSLSIAVVTNQSQTYLNAEEIVDHAAVIKRICKGTLGSCYIDSICKMDHDD